MGKGLSKLANELGERLCSPKEWTARRVSSHWTCSFAKVGASFFILDFEDSPEGNQSDWERFLSDREQFLMDTDFSTGIIEVWLGGGALISALNVDARPWLSRSIDDSVGRLWAWIGLGAVPSLKASFLLCETSDVKKSTLGMEWIENWKALVPLMTDHLAGWQAREAEVLSAEHHLVEDHLSLSLGKKGSISGFGLLDTSVVERVLHWLRLVKGASLEKLSLDLAHLGFLTKTVEKRFSYELESMGVELVSSFEQGEPLAQECCREMVALLRDDLQSMRTHSDSLQRELSLERQRVMDAVGEKKAFVNVLQNELKGSLNGVSSMLTLLKATELEVEQKEYLGLALTSSGNMSTTLSRLQDYVALDAGQVDAKVSKVEVGVLLTSIRDRWLPIVEKKGLSLDLDHFAPSSLRVKMDQERVTKILDELIKNSFGETQEGGIVIKSELVEDGKKEVSLRFEVSDSGNGMDEDQVNAIFREFYRQDLFGAHQFENLGIGLSLCHKLACFMGGRMGVYSRRGQGARFWLILKLDRVRPGREKCPVAEMKGLKVLEGMNALIVDENPISRKVLVQQLEKFGFEVEVTGSSHGALHLLRSEPFDFVMLGLSMPDMNGLELVSTLKDEMSRVEQRWPVILGLSRSFSAELHGQCLEAGMSGVLGKPLVLASLKKFFTEAFVL